MGRNKYLLTIPLGLFMPLVLLAQWEPDMRLTDDPFESRTSFNNAWCVASSGANVHVVWHDNRDGNTEIYYKRSTDNGTNWGIDTRLTTDASWSERPSVAVSDSIVHVAWYDGRLGPPRIFYKRSLDNGTNWGPDISLTPTAGVAYHPSVAVSDSIVHVVWTDMSAGPQIYYTRSLDNGTTWETARIITPDAPPAGKNLASVAVSDSIVHVVYADFRYGAELPKIYYIRSLDDGTNWETETSLADSFTSWYPSVAVSDSIVHAVWPDNRNGDTSEIYYKRSLDNGTNWGTDIRLTDNLSESREPSVVVSGSYVHVVWHDSRDGNWEIYYKRNPTGNVGIIEQEKTFARHPRSLFVPSFFNDQITIRFNQPLKGPLKITLYDICGVSVFSAAYASVPSLLSLSDKRILHLAPGVYFLCIDLNKQTETQKLIKLK